MSKRLMFMFYKIYYFFKNWFADTFWGVNNHRVPIATAICGTIWFLIEPGPEPAVVLITSLIAVSVSKKNSNDKWYTKTQGDLYVISFRCDTLTEQERLALAKDFTNKIEFLCKYKVAVNKGDMLNQLYLDAVGCNEEEISTLARQHFVLYYIEKNGAQIYNKYDQEAAAI